MADYEGLKRRTDKLYQHMMKKIRNSTIDSFQKYYDKIYLREPDYSQSKKNAARINKAAADSEISQFKELENFITYIAESSILVFDNEFNYKLIQFKDIDFKTHPLHNKYVNIIIHYRDDDTVDTFLDVLGSVNSIKGVLTKLMFGSKALETDTHEGCGITGTKCLTPRLTIKCFQLLNQELLNHKYKPDGSITTVSLGNNKGFMTQRYERIADLRPLKKSSTIKKKPTKQNSSTKNNQRTNKRFPGTGKKITNDNRKNRLSTNNTRKLRVNRLSPKKVIRNNSGKGNSQNYGGGFRKRRISKRKNEYSSKT